MAIPALIEQLGASDPDARQRAAGMLVSVGADAVAPLIEALSNAPAPVAKGSMWVLRRIGEPALRPLAEAISSESDSGALGRASATFSQLQVSSLDAYVPAFSHPSPKVRVPAVLLFRHLRQHALPYAPALAALLGDPALEVREALLDVFAAIGGEAVPLLQEARQAPGRQRRLALLALAEAGGWAALSDRDQQLIQRLVRIKQAREVPEPVTWRGSWLAIPTEDQAAVLAALTLSGSRPVTMRFGITAWTHDQRHAFWHGEHQQCARAYVTPALNGWILIFGTLPELAHPGPLPTGNSYQDIQQAHPVHREALFRLCRKLSERFGAAHWYGADCADLWTEWCLAERGKIVRYYDSEFPDDSAGPPHPAESGYLLPHESGFPPGAFEGVSYNDTEAFHARYWQLKQDLDIPDTAHATTIAARVSVNPEALSPDMKVTGHGVIAATTCNQYLPSPPGTVVI